MVGTSLNGETKGTMVWSEHTEVIWITPKHRTCKWVWYGQLQHVAIFLDSFVSQFRSKAFNSINCKTFAHTMYHQKLPELLDL